MTVPAPILDCVSQQDWEDWLQAHGDSSEAIWLRLAKKAAGAQAPSLTYAEAVDSALCFGWIDGQKRTESALHWLQRFTPRRARSLWSKINTVKVQRLEQAGRMRPAGLREVARAKADGRWDKAYTSLNSSVVPADLQAALDAHPQARAFFETLNGQNRYAILFRIQSVKKAETRARKIAQFVDMLASGGKLHP